MLLPDNIDPELSVYYNGAIVLECLQSKTKQELIELYTNVKEKKNITFSLYLLCLDWLYLIDLARYTNGGDVELCS